MRRFRGVSAALLWTIAPYAALPKPRRAPVCCQLCADGQTCKPEQPLRRQCIRQQVQLRRPLTISKYHTLSSPYCNCANNTCCLATQLSRQEAQGWRGWKQMPVKSGVALTPVALPRLQLCCQAGGAWRVWTGLRLSQMEPRSDAPCNGSSEKLCQAGIARIRKLARRGRRCCIVDMQHTRHNCTWRRTFQIPRGCHKTTRDTADAESSRIFLRQRRKRMRAFSPD